MGAPCPVFQFLTMASFLPTPTSQKLTEFWWRLSMMLDPSLQPTRLPDASPVAQPCQQRITCAFTPTSHLCLIFPCLQLNPSVAEVGWLFIKLVFLPSMLTAGAHLLASLDVRRGHTTRSYDQIWPVKRDKKWWVPLPDLPLKPAQSSTLISPNLPVGGQCPRWLQMPHVEEARTSIYLDDHTEQNLLSLPHLPATIIGMFCAISKLLLSSSTAIPGFIC